VVRDGGVVKKVLGDGGVVKKVKEEMEVMLGKWNEI
jgi:hypothetical protein